MFLALSKVDSVKFENSKAVYGRAKCLVCYRRAPLRSWELGEDDGRLIRARVSQLFSFDFLIRQLLSFSL